MIKKTSFNSIVLLAMLLSFIADAIAQNETDTDTIPETATVSETTTTDIPATTQIPANTDSSTVNKTLKNSTLIDNLQNDVAGLLLGTKAVSLMFNDKESADIERAVNALKNHQTYVPEDGFSDKKSATAIDQKDLDELNKKSHIYLASIMYYNPKSWAVWINDKKITSDDNKSSKEIYLKSVEKDKVSVLWSVSPTKLRVLLGKGADDLNFKLNDVGQIEVKFSLKPNQSFILGSNTVVEGRAAINNLTQNNLPSNSAISSLKNLF